MNKRNIYLGIIIILTLLLIVIIGMIGFKNLEKDKSINDNDQDKQTKQQEKSYTGNISCEILDKNDEIYETYFIENIEVENDKVKTNETKHKIIYKNSENYQGFKENETVIDPIYDDENLTIEYTFKEKYEVPNEDVNEYIKNLTDNGYKCEKAS